MLTHMPCFVKDNLTFLNKCQWETKHKTVIATLDVVTLYPCYPHDLGQLLMTSLLIF